MKIIPKLAATSWTRLTHEIRAASSKGWMAGRGPIPMVRFARAAFSEPPKRARVCYFASAL